MGNFDQHYEAGKKYAVIAAGIAAFLALEWGATGTETILAAVVAGIYGIVGSLIPDIDHQDSRPRRTAGKYVSISVIIAVFALPTLSPEFVRGLGQFAHVFGASGDTLTIGSGVLLVSGVAVLLLGGNAFDSILTHRGFTHSLPFAFITGLISYFSIGIVGQTFQPIAFLDGEMGVIIAFAAAGGVIVHLVVDQEL
ncbi:hypothetical protein G6M89_20840 [Natronolimnobius sp. AArcel1]|uniref:metal-dependent hydrolase n=1 Tax=Natronolimnobius sp. AArcel1 TaxID=1679093 RepID=UPI0013EA10AC|nr:metal-dependent hydrolase [Natronolimnobius sp. AArcel1]NGM71409.1 hypothetical protein [Natronolimnobius sp. AArcel1]